MNICIRGLHITNNISDDHHPAPTFTPPELPKRVHVRGVTTGKRWKELRKPQTKHKPETQNFRSVYSNSFSSALHSCIHVNHIIHSSRTANNFHQNQWRILALPPCELFRRFFLIWSAHHNAFLFCTVIHSHFHNKKSPKSTKRLSPPRRELSPYRLTRCIHA